MALLASRSLPEIDQASPRAAADIELLHGLVGIESLSHQEGPAVAYLRSQGGPVRPPEGARLVVGAR